MNPLFDKRYVNMGDLQFLHHIKDQEYVIFSNASVRLMMRGVLEEVGYHNLQITRRGKFLSRYVALGTEVIVQDTYHLPHMHRQVGKVVGINDAFIDADGIDEYGYVIHRKQPTTCVSVQFPHLVGQTWCFYKPEDLYGRIATMEVNQDNPEFFRIR